VFIGCLGCFAGLTLGGLAAFVLQIRGLDLAFLMPEGVTISGFAMSTTVHALVTPPVFLWTGGIVLGAMLLLSLLIMRRIKKIGLAETLR